ncbi:uncharacterized protein LOC116619267 [Nematostella vectensis]|uniref:uncharacterized protein LOC116619267 n=1 Tax=Nematostella vectensis TaxID=45351 RepID=UPI0013904171|nr:uncharacterized protein LOC116619267 [Nematostella vectensis]
MAACTARFALRTSCRLTSRSMISSSSKCLTETRVAAMARKHPRVTSASHLPSNSMHTTILQTSQTQYQHPPLAFVSSSLLLLHSPGSVSLEEALSEGEEEATNGRKRIKPHECQTDDP